MQSTMASFAKCAVLCMLLQSASAVSGPSLAPVPLPEPQDEVLSDQCPAGKLSGEEYGDLPLFYGLKATYYSQQDSCKPLNETVLANFVKLTPDAELTRCQPAGDYDIYANVWPGVPPLPITTWQNCFSARLDGYVLVANNTELQFLASEPNIAYYNLHRVCLWNTNQASLRIGSTVNLTTVPGNFELQLQCADVPLGPGLHPIHIKYTMGLAVTSILKLFVIPVTQVAIDFSYNRNEPVVSFACDSCETFSGPIGDDCCPPLQTCAFRSASCSNAVSPVPAPAPVL